MYHQRTDKARVSGRALAMLRSQKRKLARMTPHQTEEYNREIDRETARWLESNSVNVVAAGRAMGTMECRSLGIDA